MVRSSLAEVGENSWLIPPLQGQICSAVPGKYTYGPGVPSPRVSRHWPDWRLTSSPVPPVPEAAAAETRVTPPGATVVVNVPVTLPSEAPLHRLVTFTAPLRPSWARDTLKLWLAVVSVLNTPISQVPFCCRLSKTCSLPLLMTRSPGMPSWSTAVTALFSSRARSPESRLVRSVPRMSGALARDHSDSWVWRSAVVSPSLLPFPTSMES